MKKAICLLAVVVLSLSLLSGCSGAVDAVPYKDGTYTGKSGEDDRGAFGEATVTVAGGRITDCKYVTWQKDGSIKDENYGKVNGEVSNQDYYNKAQLAVAAMKQYADRLVEAQNLADVDTISGATIAFNQFKEAAGRALDEAGK